MQPECIGKGILYCFTFHGLLCGLVDLFDVSEVKFELIDESVSMWVTRDVNIRLQFYKILEKIAKDKTIIKFASAKTTSSNYSPE